MRVEPAPSRWLFPTPERGPGRSGGVGGDLEPGTLLAAYRSGLFPMPHEGAGSPGFPPNPRAIIEVDQLAVSRSLRRSTRSFTVTHDRCFERSRGGLCEPRTPQRLDHERIRRSVRTDCTRWAGLTASRFGTRRRNWPVVSTEFRSGVCSPESRCSTEHRRIQGGLGRTWSTCSGRCMTPFSTSSGSPGTWLRWARSRSPRSQLSRPARHRLDRSHRPVRARHVRFG